MSVLTRRNKYTYLMLISFSSNKFQRDLSGGTGRGGDTPKNSWWGCAAQFSKS